MNASAQGRCSLCAGPVERLHASIRRSRPGPGVADIALTHALQTPAPLSATDRYGFFAASTDLLGGLTPIEALTWTCAGDRLPDAEAQLLLAAATHERLHAVLGAAETLVPLRAV